VASEITVSTNPPLYGLVLAGGRSRRMGRDKAALAYQDGVPHARRTADLLAGICERVFVSCRADQESDPTLSGIGKIPDAFDIGGPLNGILSALSAYPHAAFLVAACDLPFLSADALQTLVAARDVTKSMTVFENPVRENFLEPLCAIYEPGYAEQARVVMHQGLTCPTKIANALDVRRLILSGPADARFLENANHPEDFQKAVAQLSGAATVIVEYFAVFRAQAKRSSEEVALDGSSLADLYERMRARHGFALSRDSVHVAINDVYASWDAVLQPGDRLVFIPPVSGG
jgi:molybdopterin-guanine dinucleotide biosynthesis protein A